jgi:DNA-binding CsgD family transcriptional regulator
MYMHPIHGSAIQSRELETLSDLIGDIYNAALDPSSWPSTIEKAAAFARGVAGWLVTRDLARNTEEIFHAAGGNLRDWADNFEKGIRAGSTRPIPSNANVGSVISNSDVTPQSEFKATRLYQDWMRPQGFVDFATAVVHKSETTAALFCVFRHERDGLVNEEMRAKLRLLVPHLRRAMLIGGTIEAKTAEAASYADAIDTLSACVFLIDRAGRLVQANVSGDAMLARGTVLRVAGGKLAAIDAVAERSLQEALARACATGSAHTAMPLVTSDGERYLAHLLPLAAHARRRAGLSHSATVAILMHKAALEIVSPLKTIAKAYKLTQSESRTILAIVQLGGVPEAAAMLGISENTVRTHLHRVFAKTDINRQADLVKLVAGYANPLAG